MLHAVLRFICFVAILALAGCNTDSYDAQLSLQLPPAHAEHVAVKSYGDYLLRPSDQVRVQVYGEADLTGDYQIDSAGYLSIPLAGRVKAAGRTTRQLERSLVSRLNNGMINDPHVSVQVSTYSPFYIHGEVKQAGQFPFKPGLTVLDAVALAGGFTYRANEDKVFLRRAGASGEVAYPTTSKILVFPGDNIRIPERYF